MNRMMGEIEMCYKFREITLLGTIKRQLWKSLLRHGFVKSVTLHTSDGFDPVKAEEAAVACGYC